MIIIVIKRIAQWYLSSGANYLSDKKISSLQTTLTTLLPEHTISISVSLGQTKKYQRLKISPKKYASFQKCFLIFFIIFLHYHSLVVENTVCRQKSFIETQTKTSQMHGLHRIDSILKINSNLERSRTIDLIYNTPTDSRKCIFFISK